jgi:hypothetical protein
MLHYDLKTNDRKCSAQLVQSLHCLFLIYMTFSDCIHDVVSDDGVIMNDGLGKKRSQHFALRREKSRNI